MQRSHWMSALALAFAVIAAGVVAMGLFGFKLGLLPWATADFLARKAPTPLALVAIALGVVALVFALMAKPRTGAVAPLLAVVIGALTYAALSAQSAHEAKFPPIHDVSTGWQAPPMPTAALATERAHEASLPVDKAPVAGEGSVIGVFAGRAVAEVNAATCTAAVPVTLAETPAQAYASALAAIKAKGLHIVVDDPSQGSLDATAINFWGVKEDVMVRVRAEGAGARVDIRSISRHGSNDRGHNCRRVTELRAAITPAA